MIRFVLIFFILSFLTNCQSVKDGIALKKKEAADEFLVEKKNPLVEPPEFGVLPVPGKELSLGEKSENIKNILSKRNNKISQTENNSSSKKIEENILNKIKNK
tara:strand:- start:169 stop:477 length:309 start_codon:yes stop_codon:yes gene_type:complete